MYSDTCIKSSCSKSEALLRRTDTFDLVGFQYASLSHISKVETVKRTLLQTDFFQSSDKKATYLTWNQKKILGIPRNRELNWTFLSIFSKKTFFTLWNNNDSFSFHFTVLKVCNTFESNSVFLFYKLSYATNQTMQPTNQPSNQCVTENDIGQGPLHHTALCYELLPSALWLTLSFGEVSRTWRGIH